MKDLDLRQQLIKGIRFFILISINVTTVTLINYVLSAKLSPLWYGNYVFLINNANLFAIFLTMGYDLSANKYFSKYLINSEPNLALGFMRTTIDKVIKAATICILITILYWFVNPLIERYYDVGGLDEEIVIWFNIAILFGVLNIFIVIMRCLGQAELGFVLGMLLPSGVTLVIALLLPSGLNTLKQFNQSILYIFLAYALTVVVGTITARAYIRQKITHASEIDRTNEQIWHRSSKIMMFYAFIAAAGNVIPINVLKLFSGISITDTQLGAFALAFTIVYTIFTIPLLTTKGTIMAILYPLYTKKNYFLLQKIILYSNRLSLAFNLFIVLIFVIFNQFISNTLTSEYTDFMLIFYLLSAGFAIDLSLNTTRTTLLMLGSEKKVLINRLITVVTQLILSLVIGYYYGMYGVCLVIILIRNFASVQMILELKKLGFKSL